MKKINKKKMKILMALVVLVALLFFTPTILKSLKFVLGIERTVDMTLKYSLNGEEFTISETAICRFDRIDWISTDIFLDREYVAYNPKTETSEDAAPLIAFMLLDLSDVDTTEKLGYDVEEIFFNAGEAEFYATGKGSAPYTDTFWCTSNDFLTVIVPKEEGGYEEKPAWSHDYLSFDKAKLFGLELISFDYKIR